MQARGRADQAGLARIGAVEAPRTAVMVADPAARLLDDQGPGADVPVPFRGQGDGGVEGAGGHERHAIGDGVALLEAHGRPRFGPVRPLHQPGVG